MKILTLFLFPFCSLFAQQVADTAYQYPIAKPRFEQGRGSVVQVASEGYYQGAYMPYGKGKIVVMGEAAMFSAQLTGPNQFPVGMNNPNARENAQLLLNILHWLDD